MPKLVVSTRFQASPDAVFAFHADATNLSRLSLAPGKFRLVNAPFPSREGDLQTFRIGVGPFTRPWHARIAAYEPGHSLTDVQEVGPFQHWRHSHVIWPDGAGTLLVDHVEFASGDGILHRLLDRVVILPALRLAFAYRHRRTHRLFEA